MTILKEGIKVRIEEPLDSFITDGIKEYTVHKVQPKYSSVSGEPYYNHEEGLELIDEEGNIYWVIIDYVKPINEEEEETMKKGNYIRVINEHFKKSTTYMQVVVVGGSEPSFEGELLTDVSPTAEEIAPMDENFTLAVEYGELTDERLEGMVVYFDEGAERAFLLPADMVEVVGA